MGRWFTHKQNIIIWLRQNGQCGDCGRHIKQVEHQYHHILRWKDGGETSIDNAVLICNEYHKSAHNNAKFQQSITISHDDFRYANFSGSGESIYAQELDNGKKEVNNLQNQQSNENDIFQGQKSFNENLRGVINKVKSLALTRDDKKQFFDKINYIRDSVHQKFQDKIKDNYSKAYNITCEANNLISSLEDLRKANDNLKKYQDDAKKYMLPKKEREEIRKRFQNVWELLNKRRKVFQEQYEKECKSNYSQYLEQYKRIENSINSNSRFSDKKTELKKVQQSTKGKKFKKEDRQKLWDLNQKIYEKITEQQNHNKRDYEHECKNNRALIIDDLNGFTVVESSDFREKREFLKKVQGKMKGKKFKPNDRTYLFEKIQEYFSEIHKIQGVVRERKQREWEERKREREVRQRAFEERLRDNIQRTKNSIDRLDDSIWKDKDIKQDKEQKLYTVSDKWKSSLRESIRKFEDRIDSKKSKISSLYKKLDDMESKLRKFWLYCSFIYSSHHLFTHKNNYDWWSFWKWNEEKNKR